MDTAGFYQKRFQKSWS